MCDEPVRVRNYLDAADTRSTLDALLKLGAGVEEAGDGRLVIRGVGLHAPLEATGGPLDVGNAGTLMRLLPGWLAGQPGGVWTLDGDDSIRRRPVDRVAEPLSAMGAELEARDGRFPPLTVRGRRAARDRVRAAGGQRPGEVLRADRRPARGRAPRRSRAGAEPRPHRAPAAPGPRAVRARRPALTVSQVDELELDEIVVPGDPSSAAFVVAAATLVPGSRVVIEDVGLNWTRTGFLRIAQRMGAVIVGDLEEPGTEADRSRWASSTWPRRRSRRPRWGPDEVPLAIDELTLVALLGAFADGETVVRGAAELRVKESDRIEAVVDGLRGLGADIEATADGFVVRGDGSPLRGGVIDARGDHRMAMLGAVAGLASVEGVEVVGMDAAAVSYPGFERDLGALLGQD